MARQAIMVAHGIGQQHPFEVLDSFAHGLRTTLTGQGYSVELVHQTHARDDGFDHSVIVSARDSRQQLAREIEVYEYWWASKTQGKASFGDVVDWVRTVALTPLRRFSFNIPLVRQLAAADRTPFVWEWAREVFRVVVTLVLFLAIAALATWLVTDAGPKAVRGLTEAVSQALRRAERDTPLQYGLKLLWFLLFTSAGIGVAALAWSLPQQVVDLRRLRRGRDDVTAGTLATGLFMAPSQAPPEIKARLKFMRYSLWMLLFLVWWLAHLVARAQAPTVYTDLARSLGWSVLPLFLVVVAAFFLKRAFVDYVSDIALYATADENSRFYETRAAILDEATRKLRWLLRQPEYADVAVAGHSLGSVIIYDAVSRLVAEAQTPNDLRAAQAPHLKNLEMLFGKVAPASPSVTRLLDRLRVAVTAPTRYSQLIGEIVQDLQKEAMTLGDTEAAGQTKPIVDQLSSIAFARLAADRQQIAAVTPAEVMGLSTMVTFGSPLDKIVYFFRTKLQGYETLRGRILDQLHGFRRRDELVTDEPGVRDDPPFDHIDTYPKRQRLYWLNVSAFMDPVSARLRFYDCDLEVRRPYLLWGIAHVKYWHDDAFYQQVLMALDEGRGRNSKRYA